MMGAVIEGMRSGRVAGWVTRRHLAGPIEWTLCPFAGINRGVVRGFGRLGGPSGLCRCRRWRSGSSSCGRRGVLTPL